VSALLLVLVEPKKEEERKNSKSLSQRSVTSGTRIHARARRGVTRRAHTHRHHHPHHRRARDDAMRVRYNNSHGERAERKRERRQSKNGNDYWIWTHNPLPSLSLVFSRIFPSRTKSKKQIFLIPRLSITQKALGRRSLAPVAVVRLLLGGEDSRTRGERARFRVHGKGRHILTLARVRKVTRDCVPLLEYYIFPFFLCDVCVSSTSSGREEGQKLNAEQLNKKSVVEKFLISVWAMRADSHIPLLLTPIFSLPQKEK